MQKKLLSVVALNVAIIIGAGIMLLAPSNVDAMAKTKLSCMDLGCQLLQGGSWVCEHKLDVNCSIAGVCYQETCLETVPPPSR